MATSKKQSPAPRRKLQKSNNINLHAAQNNELIVVGIGASAGGLQALQTLFGALPSNTGMAFVVITHLHSEHESHLPELLQTRTQMPVNQVTGLMPIEKDHVYVIPPNRRLVMEDSKIDLTEFKESRGQRAPIDYFFRSLARAHPNSVGIILSGGGTDGAVGVKAIKEEGGLLMVQHPDEAEYNSMPRAAIATGLADVVLPVKDLAVKLVDQANQKITQARDLFYVLFNANPIPTALIRAEDDVLINVNAQFLNYFNIQRDKTIGRKAQEFGLELGQRQNPVAQTREDFIDYLKQEGKSGLYETEIKNPQGESRTILVSVQYINLDSTEALITTFIDVTERVNAERQIRDLASALTVAEQAERHRIAQILHDDLQQRIFAIQMQMSFLKDAYEKNDLQAFKVDFPQLEIWLAEAIQVTRQLSVDLSPPILRGEGLAEAVLWLASQMQDQYGLETEIKSKGQPSELDEKVRVLAFYAVRESLFNIVKHSGILKATVNFEHRNDHLHLTVSDKGKGFDQATVMSDPKIVHGLLTIHHRLSLLGGSMNVESQPGKGTTVIIEVPYEKMDS